MSKQRKSTPKPRKGDPATPQAPRPAGKSTPKPTPKGNKPKPTPDQDFRIPAE